MCDAPPALHRWLSLSLAIAYPMLPAGFSALRVMLLGGNQLGSWAAVDQLDRFPALEEARLSDNPVTASAPSTARYQCIARIRWVGAAGKAARLLCWRGLVAVGTDVSAWCMKCVCL